MGTTFWDVKHEPGNKLLITLAMFQKIERPFLEAVKMTLGDRYTDNVENIYKITIKLIIETLEKGYNGCKS